MVTKKPVADKKTAVKKTTDKKPALAKRSTKTVKPKKTIEVVAEKKLIIEPIKTETPVKMTTPVIEGKYIAALGRRKEATARVRLIPNGSGIITINAKKLTEYFPAEWQQLNIKAPLAAVGALETYDISVKVEGGGFMGQAESVRHGIARALLIIDENYRKTLRRAGFLTRDPRAKERKKPGLKRARRAPQWKKR